MNVRNLLYVLAILFATTAISADNKSAASGAAKEQPPPHATCLNQCAANEQRCSRDVRHARTQCQKVAANGGRDVFTGRPATTSNGSGSRYESDNGIACYRKPMCDSRIDYLVGGRIPAVPENNLSRPAYICRPVEIDHPART